MRIKIFIKHKLKKKYLKVLISLAIIIFAGVLAIYFFILKDLPFPTRLNSSSVPQSTQIFDRNQKLLYTIYSAKNQNFLPLSQIPKHVQQATIAIEDKDLIFRRVNSI